MSGSPKVSVVIPNYNHALFLRRRLETVLQQTYAVDEIIFLDDASTDESLAVIEAFLPDPRIRVLVNSQNSGSAFRQWNRGVELARGEYVWIAESDDYSDARFLETLVSALERHPAAGLAYCRSVSVDSNERTIGTWKPVHGAARWETSFVNFGEEECRRFMVRENTIPNASAVVFRREVFLRVGRAPEDVKITGDWLLWARMLKASDVVYHARPLSFFRTHAGTVRMATLRTGLVAEENFGVLKYFLGTFSIPRDVAAAAFRANVDLWMILAIRYCLPYAVNRRILEKAQEVRPNCGMYLLWRLVVAVVFRVPFLAAKGIVTRAAAVLEAAGAGFGGRGQSGGPEVS